MLSMSINKRKSDLAYKLLRDKQHYESVIESKLLSIHCQESQPILSCSYSDMLFLFFSRFLLAILPVLYRYNNY